MTELTVILPMSLTMEQQRAILRYLSGGYLSKSEWRDALAGFDRLRQALVKEGLLERSLAEFYREVVDNVYASSLLAEHKEGMEMKDKTFNDLTEEEFSEVLDNILREDFGDLSEEQFFTALSAIDEETQEDIFFTGEIREGQLVLDKEAPVHVEGNAIYWGNKRLIIRLRN